MAKFGKKTNKNVSKFSIDGTSTFDTFLDSSFVPSSSSSYFATSRKIKSKKELQHSEKKTDLRYSNGLKKLKHYLLKLSLLFTPLPRF